MKTANIVGLVLFISVASYSILVLLGSVLKPFIVGLLFFIILFLFFLIILFSNDFPKKILIFFEILVFCLCFGLLLGGLKVYIINDEDTGVQQELIQNDIEQISQKNDYYLSYIDYLKDNIMIVHANNLEVNAKINKEQKKLGNLRDEVIIQDYERYDNYEESIIEDYVYKEYEVEDDD